MACKTSKLVKKLAPVFEDLSEHIKTEMFERERKIAEEKKAEKKRRCLSLTTLLKKAEKSERKKVLVSKKHQIQIFSTCIYFDPMIGGYRLKASYPARGITQKKNIFLSAKIIIEPAESNTIHRITYENEEGMDEELIVDLDKKIILSHTICEDGFETYGLGD